MSTTAAENRTCALARDALVTEYLPNARAIARRYYRHGESLDDLVQVAVEGLLMAAKRFDPDRGAPFVAFANVTMAGTIKRHFRDRGWAVRVPRRVHELAGPVSQAVGALEQGLGRPPTISEIADVVGVDAQAIEEVLVATRARTTCSVDADEAVGRQLTDPVDAVERSADRSALRQAVRNVPAEWQYVLVRYFEDGCTQSQIGAEIGRSQMQVSRMIKRALAELRAALA